MKPKILKLKSAFTFDFQLYGIISNAKEYTLSWAINFISSLELRKSDDIIIDLKGVDKLIVSVYHYKTEQFKIYLYNNHLKDVEDLESPKDLESLKDLESSKYERNDIKNKGNASKFFVASQSQFDYLLKIETDEGEDAINELFLDIRKSDKIQSILKLDINKIKEKEYLLF